MKQAGINIRFLQEMAAKMSMNLHLCVYDKYIHTRSMKLRRPVVLVLISFWLLG